MKIRSRLLVLVLAVLLPPLVGALASARFLYQEQREALERGVRETVRALSLVVDREIGRREALLRTLAAAPVLQRGDLPAFHDFARQLVRDADSAIMLTTPAGEQLLNTRLPFGTPLPRISETLTKARANADRLSTVVSDLYLPAVGNGWSYAVQVPVVRQGELVGYLSMVMNASQLQRVFVEQQLPPTWVGSLLDRSLRVAARSQQPHLFVGRPSRPEHERLLAGRDEGRIDTVSLDGTAVLAFFHRSKGIGWTFVIGVPRAEIEALSRRALGALAGLSLLVLALGTVAALLIARGIVRPARELAEAAEALGRNERVSAPRSGLAEVDTVGDALERASVQLREANRVLEERVAQARSEAARAHAAALQSQKLEALGRLTGGVAHDFNNLLMVISNNVHVLRRRLPGPWNETPQLAAIERSVHTGAKLTRQLLAFARRQPLRAEVIALEERLPAIVDMVRPAVGSAVQVQVVVQPGTLPVEVDLAELELAVLNLAVNANDAMPDGGRLEFEARNARPGESGVPGNGQRFVCVEVRDTGSGIAPELLERVFEPFFTTKPVGQGTGLGLSQVYGFCSQTGGTVRIDSAPGRGTTVRMVLKAADAPPAVPEPPSAPAPDLNCRVLLVEDNEDLGDATAQLLAALGCVVDRASSGDEAQARLVQDPQQVDLVLSDIRMPGRLDGIELAAWMRQHLPQVPVLLMTGYAGELQSGAQRGLDVLAKPFDPQTLASAMLAALRRNTATAG